MISITKKTTVKEKRNDNAHQNCYEKVPKFSPAGILGKRSLKWKIKLPAEVAE